MAYCTQNDILDKIDEKKLLQLADDKGRGRLDHKDVSDVIDEAIAGADADIDARCRGRFTIPLSPVPAKIRACSVDISIYNLYSRRTSPPAIRIQRHKDAIAFLDKVNAGKIDLGVETPAVTDDGNPVRVTTDKDDRTFTMDKMSSF